VIPAIEQAYDYGRSSARRPGGGLALATSGGSVSAPTLFVGRILLPDLVADGLLVIGSVARSRYHVPAAMLARILLAADPIVTVGDGRVRFESLSACSGVYARLDLLPDAVDGTVIGRGTTNVDLDPTCEPRSQGSTRALPSTWRSAANGSRSASRMRACASGACRSPPGGSGA
jgi:hypothetical protein